MELGLQYEQLKCYSCVLDTVMRREEAQEAIVSDTYPDIASIVNASGMVMLSQCCISGDTISAEGRINAMVLYEPEGTAGFQALEVQIPYRCSTEAASADERCHLHTSVQLHSVEVKVLNPRKVYVRAEVSLHVQAYRDDTCHYSVALNEPDETLCTKQEQVELGYIAQVTEKRFPFEEFINLNPGSTPERLISWETVPYCNEAKLVGSRVVFQGGLKTKFRFLTAEGMYFTEDYDLPMSQVLEAGSAGEGAVPVIHLAISDGDVFLDGNDAVQLHLEIQVWGIIYDQQRREVLTDAYSIKAPSNCTSDTLSSFCLTAHDVRTLSFRQPLDVLMPSSEVVEQSVQLCEMTNGDNPNEYKCRLKIHLCMRDSNGELSQMEQCCYVPIQLPTCACDMKWVECFLMDAVCISAAGGVEVRGNLHLDYVFLCRSSYTTLSTITVNGSAEVEPSLRPSAVLRMLHSNETLWDLGKAYASTVEDIMTVNQINDEREAGNRFLLIPRKR